MFVFDGSPDEELERLIADRVMGSPELCSFCCPNCNGTTFSGYSIAGVRACQDEYGMHCSWQGPARQALPHYTTDIDAAWQVIGALMQLHDSETQQRFGLWFRDAMLYVDSAAVAAMRICRAAVAAVDGKVLGPMGVRDGSGC